MFTNHSIVCLLSPHAGPNDQKMGLWQTLICTCNMVTYYFIFCWISSVQEQIDEKMRGVSGHASRLGARLLVPDVMEPFGEKDDRDHEAR